MNAPRSGIALVPCGHATFCAACADILTGILVCQSRIDMLLLRPYNRKFHTISIVNVRCTIKQQYVFTALHVMQTRYSDENSVCPAVCLSVCLSVTRVDCDKTVERSVQIYIQYERTFSLVF